MGSKKLWSRRGPAHVTLETSSVAFNLSYDPRSHPLNNFKSARYRKQNPLYTHHRQVVNMDLSETMLVDTLSFQLLIMQAITLDTKSRVQPKTTRHTY